MSLGTHGARGAGMIGRRSIGAGVTIVLGIAMAGTARASAHQDPLTLDLPEVARDDRGPRPTLTFTPCPENPALECGFLTVRLNYPEPAAGLLRIAVIRAKATDPARRIGVLVANPGGPGLSGVDFVLGGAASPAFTRLRARFDIVSFDPRGVARSGQVSCRPTLPPVPADPDDEPAIADFLDELGRRFYQACREQSGASVDFLGTNNVARDMDVLRQALGERQITYASGSYGSELGAVYASLFPERVRAALLDGAAGPDYRDDLVESWSQPLAGFETALEYLDRLCRRASSCRLAEPGVVAAYDDVRAGLRISPVPTPSGDPLTGVRLMDLVASLLGIEQLYPLIVDALADARTGDYQLLIQLLPATQRGPAAQVPILCNNYGTRLSGERLLPIDDVVGRRNPRFAERFFVAERVALCGAFPRTTDTSLVRNVRGKTANPLLVVGNQFDPNTPLTGARRLAGALGMEGSLLVYEGGGHTAFFNGNACVAAAIEAYLFDLRVPPEGSSCAPQPLDFSEAASFRTSTPPGADVGARVGTWHAAAPASLPSSGSTLDGRNR